MSKSPDLERSSSGDEDVYGCGVCYDDLRTTAGKNMQDGRLCVCACERASVLCVAACLKEYACRSHLAMPGRARLVFSLLCQRWRGLEPLPHVHDAAWEHSFSRSGEAARQEDAEEKRRLARTWRRVAPGRRVSRRDCQCRTQCALKGGRRECAREGSRHADAREGGQPLGC